jgi:hypothetical protein
MKGRETAAGAPFGGGGVSFLGYGGEALTEGLMIISDGKCDANGIRQGLESF